MSRTTEVPEFTRLDADVVWRMGVALVDECRAAGHAVTISARLGKQRVFHAALPGTSADNDAWVERKLRIVEHFGISSLEVYERFVGEGGSFGDFLTAFALPGELYAPAGGAVPLRVAGVLAGGLAVSGLDSTTDHELALEAIRRSAA